VAWFPSPPELDPVERVPRLDASTFVRDYLHRRPVVLTQMTSDWLAPGRWSPAYLRERAGEVRVTARQYARGRDRAFLQQTIATKRHLPLADYLDFITGEAPDALDGEVLSWSLRENQEVLRLRRRLKDELGFADLFPDVTTELQPFLWFGPDGYVTGFHIDLIDFNVLAQLWGEKDVVLFSPEHDDALYPDPFEVEDGRYSLIDSYAPDLSLHPAFAEARGVETRLVPGELLYIPRGWWHATRSVGLSTSVNGTCRDLPALSSSERAT
jgi:hypothetical protein